MVKSVLDTDLYKLTMQNAICKLYPRTIVQYVFINRGKTEFPENTYEALILPNYPLSDLLFLTLMSHQIQQKAEILDVGASFLLAGYNLQW